MNYFTSLGCFKSANLFSHQRPWQEEGGHFFMWGYKGVEGHQTRVQPVSSQVTVLGRTAEHLHILLGT